MKTKDGAGVETLARVEVTIDPDRARQFFHAFPVFFRFPRALFQGGLFLSHKPSVRDRISVYVDMLTRIVEKKKKKRSTRRRGRGSEKGRGHVYIITCLYRFNQCFIIGVNLKF